MGCCISIDNNKKQPLSYYNPDNDIITYKPNKLNSRKTYINTNDIKHYNENEVCYLISSSWLDDWLDYCTNDIKSIKKPKAINNAVLLDKSTGYLLPNILIKKDYRTIKSNVWEYLFSHYGGGPVLYIRVPSGLPEKLYKKGGWLKEVNIHNVINIIHPEHKILPILNKQTNKDRVSINPIVEMSLYAFQENVGYSKIHAAIELQKEITAENNEAIAALIAKDLGKAKFKEAEKLNEEVKDNTNEALASLFVEDLAKRKQEEAEKKRLEAEISQKHRVMENLKGLGAKHRFKGLLSIGEIDAAKVEAAKMLQSAWRSKLAKRLFIKQKEDRQKLLEESMAIKLQSRWRIRKSKEKVKLLKEKQLRLRQEGAAILLQASYRIHKKRKLIYKLKLEKQKLLEEGSAMIVQSAWRRKKAKQKVDKLKQERLLYNQRYNKAKSIVSNVIIRFISKLKYRIAKRNQPNLLLVFIKNASGLLVADFTGSSDPFIYIQGINGKDHSCINLYQTSVISANVNPIWNEMCYLPNMTGNDKIVLTICDKDMIGPSEFLGQVIIDLKEHPKLFDGKEINLQLPLTNYSNPVNHFTDNQLKDVHIDNTSNQATGSLNLTLQLPPLAYSHYGYLEKKTKGTFGLGLTGKHYKKRILLLTSSSLSYFNDIYSLSKHPQGQVHNTDIKSIQYHKKDNSYYLLFTFHNKDTWDIKFLDNESDRVIETWLRKLSNCCKHLPKLTLSTSQKIK